MDKIIIKEMEKCVKYNDCDKFESLLKVFQRNNKNIPKNEYVIEYVTQKGFLEIIKLLKRYGFSYRAYRAYRAYCVYFTNMAANYEQIEILDWLEETE